MAIFFTTAMSQFFSMPLPSARAFRCVCRESIDGCKKIECCVKDDSRPITVAVQAEAVNHLPVLVE